MLICAKSNPIHWNFLSKGRKFHHWENGYTKSVYYSYKIKFDRKNKKQYIIIDNTYRYDIVNVTIENEIPVYILLIKNTCAKRESFKVLPKN